MNAYSLLLAEILISATTSVVALKILSRPLINVLGQICPDEQAAIFWLSYTKVMLMITPLIFVLILDMFTRFSDPMYNLRLALVAALGGLLVGMYAIGTRLGRFVITPNGAGMTK